jgi:signal transduction histidine kinase
MVNLPLNAETESVAIRATAIADDEAASARAVRQTAGERVDGDRPELDGIGPRVRAVLAAARHHGVELDPIELRLAGGAVAPTASELAEWAQNGGMWARAVRLRWPGLLRFQDSGPVVLLFADGSAGLLIGASVERNLVFLKRADAPPDSEATAVDQLRLSEVWTGEAVLLARHGREVPVSVVAVAHRGADGSIEFLSAIVRDMTERKRIDAELRRQREALYQTEKLATMGTVLAGVAHELNNPLTAVTGYANLLRQELAGTPSATRAEAIAHAADRCASIVRNFLALARRHPPERQLVRLNDIARDAAELAEFLQYIVIEMLYLRISGLRGMLSPKQDSQNRRLLKERV